MMDFKMKSTIIVTVAILFLCGSQITMANTGLEIRTVWPEAVTFSKLQMTRLDIIDPSYEARRNNIRRSTNTGGPFNRWETLINQSL